MMFVQRIFAIIIKEIRQLGRDRLTFGMIIGIPLMQIILFGYAINMDVRHLNGGIVDLADTYSSRKFTAAIQATQVIDFVVTSDSAEGLIDRMRQGDIKVGVVIPADFDRRLVDSSRAAAQLLIDGSDTSIANIAAQLRDMRFDIRSVTSAQKVSLLEVRNYFNPERRSAVQIVPALIGVILNLTMVLFTSVAVVRERERGNLEMLITTPIRNIELMIGKITPYVVIGLIQVSIILAVGILLFNIPIVGSMLDLYAGSLIFIAATLSLGLAISTWAKTQFQAMQLTFFTYLPSILLSGFMFPYDGMPQFAQWLGKLLPLTHFVEMIRGIVLRGATFSDLWSSTLALLVFFVVMMSIAVLRFRKRLD